MGWESLFWEYFCGNRFRPKCQTQFTGLPILFMLSNCYNTKKDHTTLLHTAASDNPAGQTGRQAPCPLTASYRRQPAANNRGMFPTRDRVRGRGGRELRFQDRRRVEANDAEHLYLQGWAPEPGGCLTGRRCPRYWSAHPPPPADAPGRKHKYKQWQIDFITVLELSLGKKMYVHSRGGRKKSIISRYSVWLYCISIDKYHVSIFY